LTPDLLVELAGGADPELVADGLWRAGATAVEIKDTGAVLASFPTGEAARLVASELGGRLIEVDPAWRDGWRAFAEPVEVGRGLLVAPAWRDVTVPSGRTVLRIDPGDCFGSGSHPSTRLVLAALDRQPPPAGARVLDAGCGSGILSVAAAVLGAGRVTAVDVDASALAVTRENARANRVAARIRVCTTPLDRLRPARAHDLAMVNVTAAVHAGVGPDVVRLTRPGGRIVVAGLLPGQWRHIAGAYPSTRVTATLELDGWLGAELTVRP
jgi:ribosomal protein L11 methyltransferase